jgi:hypothetical protein
MKHLTEKAEETESICGMTEIGRASRETHAGRTEYRLYRKDVESESFWMSIQSQDSHEGGFLIGSLSEVSLLFEKTVSGEVPPYILSEILEDYSKERELSLIKN